MRGKLFYAVPYVGVAANWLGNHDRGVFVKFAAVGLIACGSILMLRGFNIRRRTPETMASTEEPASA